MNSSVNASQSWAERRRHETAPDARAQLEAQLTPLIRCVLRTGAGVPALVQWVQRTLPNMPAVDPEVTAPRMARMLSAQLIRQGNPDVLVGRLAGETVVGV